MSGLGTDEVRGLAQRSSDGDAVRYGVDEWSGDGRGKGD